ncbi:MAG TPA: hypothetical protein VJW76_09540 [Verrucomicrobiae bacterium]|nr:hypothetical protein [Verrucomicrobiae bacterium]
MNGNAHSLVASLIWGAIGLGLFVYGKRQQAMTPLFGGLLLIGISYFVGSALYMSLAGIALLAVIYWRHKEGL